MFTLSIIVIIATLVYITRRTNMTKANVSEYVRYSDDYAKARASVREHVRNDEYNVFGQWVNMDYDTLYNLANKSVNACMRHSLIDIEYTRDRTIISVLYTNSATFEFEIVKVSLGNSFNGSAESTIGNWYVEALVSNIEIYAEQKG